MITVRPATRAVARCAVVSRAHSSRQADGAVKDVQLAPLSKTALTAALANVVMAAPASAGGALFNFDLTFPIMLGQFLLLTVFLEKTWFTPVGKLLDQRDEDIRKKLESVQGDTQELARLQQEAEKVLREAREEANAAIEQANKEAKAEQDAKIEETKAKLEKELEEALKKLDDEREQAEQQIRAQAETVADDIVAQILPESSKVKKGQKTAA